MIGTLILQNLHGNDILQLFLIILG